MGQVIWSSGSEEKAVELELIMDGAAPCGLMLLLDNIPESLYKPGDELFWGMPSEGFKAFHGTTISLNKHEAAQIENAIATLFPAWGKPLPEPDAHIEVGEAVPEDEVVPECDNFVAELSPRPLTRVMKLIRKVAWIKRELMTWLLKLMGR